MRTRLSRVTGRPLLPVIGIQETLLPFPGNRLRAINSAAVNRFDTLSPGARCCVGQQRVIGATCQQTQLVLCFVTDRFVLLGSRWQRHEALRHTAHIPISSNDKVRETATVAVGSFTLVISSEWKLLW